MKKIATVPPVPSAPKAPMKIGKVGIRTPKSKKMPSAFGKPSLFFKSEEIKPKHPNLRNLWDFVQKKRARS